MQLDKAVLGDYLSDPAEFNSAVRDAFVGGLRDDWDLRERRPGDLHPTAAVEGQGRWLCRMRPLVWVVPTKLENSLARSHRSRFG